MIHKEYQDIFGFSMKKQNLGGLYDMSCLVRSLELLAGIIAWL